MSFRDKVFLIVLVGSSSIYTLDQNTGFIAGATQSGQSKFIKAFHQITTVCYDIQASPVDEFIYFGGYTTNGAIACCSGGDAIVGKLATSTGAVSWFQSFGTITNLDKILSIAISSNGQIIFASGISNQDSFIAAFSSSGNFLWSKKSGCSTQYDQFSDSLVEPTNNFIYLVGQTSCVTPTTQSQIFLMKLKINNQAEIWSNFFGSNTLNDEGQSIAYSNYDESVYISGRTQDSNGKYGGLLMKVNSAGVQQFGFKFLGTTSNNDKCAGITANGDGRVIYLICYTEDVGTLGSTVILKIKGTDGTIIKQSIFDYDKKDAGHSIKTDKYGNLAFVINSLSTPFTFLSKTSAAIVRMTTELRDWNAFTSTSQTLSALSAQFVSGSLSSYHSVLTAITFTIAPSANLYQSVTTFSSFSQGSVASNNLIPPLMTIQTFPQSSYLSISISNFCQGAFTKTSTQSGLDIDQSTLPTGLAYSSSTQKITGTPTQYGVYQIKATYQISVSNLQSTVFTLNITKIPDRVIDFAFNPSFVYLDQKYSYQFTLTTFVTELASYLPIKATAMFANGTALPSWLTFDSITNKFSGTPLYKSYPNLDYALDFPIVLKVTNNIGNYYITNTAILQIYPSQSYSVVNKGPPYFLQELKDQNVRAGESKVYIMPSYKDFDDTTVNIKVDLGRANSFTRFTNNQFTIKPWDGDQIIQQGIYVIKIQLTDSNKFPLSQYYSFKIIVGDPIYDENPIDQYTPIPFIESISNQGEVLILFNQEMIIPENFWLFNENQLDLKLIRINQNEEQDLFKFQWQINNFQSKFMTILITFENPLEISKFEEQDQLNITFIDIYQFKNANIKRFVQRGFSISEKIPKQILNDCKTLHSYCLYRFFNCT
eukprot:403332642